jgi:hypothetical protein
MSKPQLAKGERKVQGSYRIKEKDETTFRKICRKLGVPPATKVAELVLDYIKIHK